MLQLLRELAKLGEKKQVDVCLFQRQLPVEPGELDLLIRDVDPCVGDPGVSISRTHARKGALVFCASGFQDHDLPPVGQKISTCRCSANAFWFAVTALAFVQAI